VTDRHFLGTRYRRRHGDDTTSAASAAAARRSFSLLLPALDAERARQTTIAGRNACADSAHDGRAFRAFVVSPAVVTEKATTLDSDKDASMCHNFEGVVAGRGSGASRGVTGARKKQQTTRHHTTSIIGRRSTAVRAVYSHCRSSTNNNRNRFRGTLVARASPPARQLGS